MTDETITLKLAELVLCVLVGIICIPALVMAIIEGCWGKRRREGR